ncbi:hypothetical protein E2C01_014204 [Portunus trituberculatus]|uniref:Uncharacterized protein n=1 Tax=Portunus trituberculatus TaxID=210409 RepID=A0A5B7DJA0_PORTR|nr:hypothetical protein [Portunus trituberculatus]
MFFDLYRTVSSSEVSSSICGGTYICVLQIVVLFYGMLAFFPEVSCTEIFVLRHLYHKSDSSFRIIPSGMFGLGDNGQYSNKVSSDVRHEIDGLYCIGFIGA